MHGYYRIMEIVEKEKGLFFYYKLKSLEFDILALNNLKFNSQ